MAGQVDQAEVRDAVPPRRELGRLSAAGQQVVSMARALARDARLIVMDEPSAVLDPEEVQNLFRSLPAQPFAPPLRLGYRYTHISNANIATRNPGGDFQLLYLGVAVHAPTRK